MANILVVEDDVTIREAYVIVFSDRGHNVHAANDGEEALALCAKNEFDIIILDVLMPKVDGFEFLKAFKPEKHPKTKVIAVSNLNSSETAAEMAKMGVLKTLHKARLTPGELAEQIEQVAREAHGG